MRDKEKLKKIIKHYGTCKQISKAVEELIELSEVLIKDVNKEELERDRLYEELADVEVMIDQIKIIYNIDPGELQDEKDIKIQRTLNRIDMESTLMPDCAWR